MLWHIAYCRSQHTLQTTVAVVKKEHPHPTLLYCSVLCTVPTVIKITALNWCVMLQTSSYDDYAS